MAPIEWLAIGSLSAAAWLVLIGRMNTGVLAFGTTVTAVMSSIASITARVLGWL